MSARDDHAELSLFFSEQSRYGRLVGRALDEIDRLRSENERLLAEREMGWTGATTLARELDRLRSENERLREDVRRLTLADDQVVAGRPIWCDAAPLPSRTTTARVSTATARSSFVLSEHLSSRTVHPWICPR